jgi:hypothetical protein
VWVQPVQHTLTRGVPQSTPLHVPYGASGSAVSCLAELWPDKDEFTRATIDAVIKARFQDPADSARTEGRALTHPQLSGLGTVSSRSRARTFRACPRTYDHAAELGLRYVSVRVVWHC